MTQPLLPGVAAQPDHLSDAEQRLLNSISYDPMGIDTLAERLLWHKPDNMPLNRELAVLYLRRNDPRRALQKLQLCFKANARDTETLALSEVVLPRDGARPRRRRSRPRRAFRGRRIPQVQRGVASKRGRSARRSLDPRNKSEDDVQRGVASPRRRPCRLGLRSPRAPDSAA